MNESSSFFAVGHRKPPETIGIQRQIPILGEARKPEFVEVNLIAALKDGRGAIGLCMQMSGYTAETLANMLGLSKGYISKCLSGRGNFPAHLRVKLMEICGNYAPLQFEAARLGLEIRDDWKARRLAQLDAERNELMRAA
jgi:hypothetical protein